MNTALTLTVVDGEPRVDSRLVAAELGIGHQGTRELIDRYFDKFQELGILQFKTGEIRGRGQPERYSLLTEDHAYFLLTLVRNTVQAVDLKKRLVLAFADCRRKLEQPANIPPAGGYLGLAKAILAQLEEQEQRVAAVEGKVSTVVDKVTAIEASLPAPNSHITIRAYTAAHGIKLENTVLSTMGKRATKLTIRRGQALVHVQDELFGHVNAYRVEVLDEVFAGYRLVA